MGAPTRTCPQPVVGPDDAGDVRSDNRSRIVVGAVLSGSFVLLAVLEVVAGLGANSPVPAWAEKVAPLAWPQPVRVVWWLGVAGAAAAYRLMLGRAGFPQRRSVTLMSVLPFLL